tara:strand:+ start:1810 stop:2388 length:579 start_codon:yes stop_codon:yes gene_type:complete
MDLKEYIYLKEDFLNPVTYNKFYKWVKNDLSFTDSVLLTGTVDKKTRKVQECSLSNYPGDKFAKKNLTSVVWYNFFVNKFKNMVFDYYDKFNIKVRGYDLDMDLQILRYEETDFYIPHVDYHKRFPRHFSFSYIINNDYEGGELIFTLANNENVSIKATANSCVMFPSNFMFPHSVKEVTKGVRYVLVGWMK